MGRNFWNHLFALPHEDDGDPNPVKVEFVTKLRLNRSNGWVVLELAQENHSHVTVWAEDGTRCLE
jgi:hypothetical protein